MDSLRRKVADKLASLAAANAIAESSGTSSSAVPNTSYSDSNLRQYWMPDAVSDDCYECGAKFTTFRRRHHCRICGQIFCSKCCSIFISGRHLKVTGSLRVCTGCYSYFERRGSSASLTQLEVANEANSGGGQVATDSPPNQSGFEPRFSFTTPTVFSRLSSQRDASDACLLNMACSNTTRKVSIAAAVMPATFLTQGGVEETSSSSETDLPDSSSLKTTSRAQIGSIDFDTLHLSLSNPDSGLVLGMHRYKMKSYPDSFTGEELLQWLLNNKKYANRTIAFDVAQILLDANFVDDLTLAFNLKDVLGGPRFHASIPYRLARREMKSSVSKDEEENEEELADADGPEWLRNVHFPQVPAYVQEAEEVNKSTNKKQHNNGDALVASPVDHQDLSQFFQNKAKDKVKKTAADHLACPALDEVYSRHQDVYLTKLLQEERLDVSEWKELVRCLSDKVVRNVQLEPEVDAFTKHIVVDIRDLVKIKKVPGGSLEDCCIVRGEVFSNQVIQRDMPMALDNANILLIQDAVSFHRPDKFTSVANLAMVEEEYVKKICSKIMSYYPKLILVEQSVCRLAQDILAEANVAVVQNVKSKVLRRVSRFFDTPVITSLSSTMIGPKLGACDKFRSRNYVKNSRGTTKKNLISLEGAEFSKGCCVILRGASKLKLAKVKRVLKQVLVLKCHSKFEKAFLHNQSSQIDHFAKLPHLSSSDLDYKITRLALTPFVEIEKEDESESSESEKEDDDDEDDEDDADEWILTKRPLLETVPLSTGLNDRKARHMVVDYRCQQHKPKWVKKKKPPVKPKKERIPGCYRKLNKPLLVSFCSYLSNSDGGSQYCIKPWTAPMSLYKFPDMPLGAFLLSYCFDTSYPCAGGTSATQNNGEGSNRSAPSCPVPMRDHGRRFVLGNTSVTLIIQTLSSPIVPDSKLSFKEEQQQDDDDDDEEEDDLEGQIFVWKFCPECQTMTELMPMSGHAWMMSFATFLLLLMYETRLTRRDASSCPHSLHNFQYTCFGLVNQVAFFKMQPIAPHGLVIPPARIVMPSNQPNEEELLEQFKQLTVHGSKVFSQINEKLINLKSVCRTSGTGIQQTVSDLLEEQEVDFKTYRHHVDHINNSLRGGGPEQQEATTRDLLVTKAKLLVLKITIMKSISKWRSKFAQFHEQKRKEDKSKPRVRVTSGSNPEKVGTMDNSHNNDNNTITTTTTVTAAATDKTKKVEEGISATKLWNSLINSGNEEDKYGITNPYPATVHPGLYHAPNILVDEAQPSSIIAYALGTSEHQEFLAKQASLPEAERNNQNISKKTLEWNFTTSNCNFFCRIYFAYEFEQFRKQVIVKADDTKDFISSLSGCRMWMSSGGKSGASFYKTEDDRFLLKQVKKTELLILQQIVRNYFEYIQKSGREGKTALTKILGLYTVAFKNTALSNLMHMNLLVIENLFYKRNISESYDLKGSNRNRLVNPTGHTGKELVLMDENLQRMACERPLYVRNVSKMLLMGAVRQDARYLSQHKVMDYSLLVGKDADTDELVVGIIDYLRPYSIDKMIESQMKKTSGLLQGTAEDPTVISPQAYQTRFHQAMDNYFVLVPDYWYEGKPPTAATTNNTDDAGKSESDK